MKSFRNGIILSLMSVSLFFMTSIINASHAYIMTDGGIEPSFVLKAKDVIMKGAFVKNPKEMVLKTLNETFLLEDADNVLMKSKDFNEHTMVQSFKVCVQGNIGKNRKNRKVMHVKSLCDE